ncbi:NADPH:quinone reductase [Micrococcales bacterium KH10]|nr:NADPH:quinone reductase [Micrococcales bacterium KH10]
MDTMMRAWVQDRYGNAAATTLRRVTVPTPGKGDVLLKVSATALNAGDIRVMSGDPYLVRLAFGLRRPRNPVRGMDVAGVIVDVGPGVDTSLIGTEVIGELSGGGLAEYVITALKRVVPKDPRIEPAIAATVPVAGGTAWQALHHGKVKAGDRILVIGASGGVGTFTVQLATDAGAEVWALCGESNRSLVESLGAAQTFDYRSTDAGDLPKSEFDAVIDIAGTAKLRDLRRLVRPGGSVVLVSGEGGRVFGPIGRLIRAFLLSIRSTRPIRPLAATAKPEVTSAILERVAAGSVVPVIERTWPLDQAQAALARVESGRTVGKVVVIPD